MAFAAGLIPMCLGFSVPPIPSLFNEVLALLLWGGLMVALGSSAGRRHRVVGAEAYTAALILLILAAWLPPLRFHVPVGYAAMTTCLLVSSMLLLQLGIRTTLSGHLPNVVLGFCWGLLVLGVFNVLAATVQVFYPAWADGQLIPLLRVPGRAIGTIRQSNHLAILLLWALLAWAYLCSVRTVPAWLRWLTCAGLVWAICLSGSRFGLLALLATSLWGVLDRRLPRGPRQTLIGGAPLALVGLLLLKLIEMSGTNGVGIAGRVDAIASEAGASRWKILADSLHLIRQHPWFGVGWGEFNFAWTLTPRDWVTVHHVTNAHNLPLHLAVEIGVPLAVLVTYLLARCLFQAMRACKAREVGATALAARIGLAMTLVVALQSQFEYSLWYAYFLLPASFFLGSALGLSANCAEPVRTDSPSGPPRRHHPLRIAGLLMMLGGAFTLFNFMQIMQIYIPPNRHAPLAARIEEGQRSIFFRSLADYAQATSTSAPPTEAFASAARAMLDENLLSAWAQRLHENGDDDKARYLIGRAQMFQGFDPDKRFSAQCGVTPPALEFPCGRPTHDWTFQDFRD